MSNHTSETIAATDLKSRVKNLVCDVLCRLGVPAVARRVRRGRLTIIMYHGIEPRPLSPDCWQVLDTPSFRRQLRYVQQHFTVLPLEEALERLEVGTLPERAATLTFDDGTQNLLTQAAPVLREMNMPAAMFLATGAMDTDEALWPDRLWLAFARTAASEVDLTPLGLGIQPLNSVADRGSVYATTVNHLKSLPDQERLSQLTSLLATLELEPDDDPGPFRMLTWARELASDGLVTLYPHTVTHPILATCSDTKVESEIVESIEEIKREIGQTPNVFAYPNGRAQDFDDRAKTVLRNQGVRWALSTVSGLAGRDSDHLALPRVGVGNDTSFAKFRLLVSGVTL